MSNQPNGTKPPVASIVQQVLASRKYRSVAPDLVAQLAAQELAKGRSLRQAVKAVKNQLHQSAGAYQAGAMSYDRWLDELREAYTAGEPEALQQVLRRILAAHASTRERLPFLEAFYTEIFALLPPVRSVLDVACGLNPLARPWMPLPATVPYLGLDIYQDQMAFIKEFFALADLAGDARAHNVLAGLPSGVYDLVLLLKTLPCLEQMDRHASQRLLDQVTAPNLVISFPRRSLGGRAKGMDAHYGERFAALWQDRPGQVTRLDFPNELVFVVTGYV